eukprot:CAMPEP_0177591720 /NCGR_PEP_ID=MMETSP0419_2-20121207/8154_1 /TAXON_ID=582737 /ORGANISM="Tetraselmis sp., Strain GSL018" /LENGTH=128 /DNA_ID=CAMNT_0019082493 /DNA_START=204 /DNA_END=587 /DNA_ORIENTATION=+
MDSDFVSAEIDRGDSEDVVVGAQQYSFFGDLDASDALELGGGLEDGIDVPPEEELPLGLDGEPLEVEDNGLEEDLSVPDMVESLKLAETSLCSSDEAVRKLRAEGGDGPLGGARPFSSGPAPGPPPRL